MEMEDSLTILECQILMKNIKRIIRIGVPSLQEAEALLSAFDKLGKQVHEKEE